MKERSERKNKTMRENKKERKVYFGKKNFSLHSNRGYNITFSIDLVSCLIS